MNQSLVRKITLLLGVALLVYLIANSLVYSRMSNLEVATRDELAEQQSLLVAIAETTARNGADAITEQIVKDCPLAERSEFDELLSRLDDGLSRPELVTLERLFGRCGSFYAERKAVMVSRLVREIEVYAYLVNQLALITETNPAEKYRIDDWENLATEEQKQSALFIELVGLQDQIISLLLTPNTNRDVELDQVLLQAQNVQDSLLVSKQQSNSIRSYLTTL